MDSLDEHDGLVKSRDTEKIILNQKHQYLSINKGILVYRYISKNDRRVFCRCTIHLYKNETDIHIKEDYPVPPVIEDIHHDALFFLRDIQEFNGMTCLESAKWPGCFLGTKEGDDTNIENVVLRRYTGENIERLSLMLINPNELGF
ncbi:hypothetical protein GN956_G24766 [Arapaima gigas]